MLYSKGYTIEHLHQTPQDHFFDKPKQKLLKMLNLLIIPGQLIHLQCGLHFSLSDQIQDQEVTLL